MKDCVYIDFETRSEVELKKVGTYNYSIHPSTVLLCICFKINGEMHTIEFKALENRRLNETSSEEIDLLTSLVVASNEFVAHNALFEKMMWQNCVQPKYNISYPTNWSCTRAKGQMYGLPASLEAMAQALQLNCQKDMKGKSAMLALSKPRDVEHTICQGCGVGYATWKLDRKHIKLCDKCYNSELFQRKTKDGGFIPYKAKSILVDKWNNDGHLFTTMYAYCRDDVNTCEEIDNNLVWQTNEYEIWKLDQKLNTRGVHIDVEAVDCAIAMVEMHDTNLRIEAADITDGAISSVKSPKQMLEYFKSQGHSIDNVDKEALREMKQGKLPENLSRIVEIRSEASRSSTAKYKVIKNHASPDSILTDNLVYHSTINGRWAGKGVQLQNLPRLMGFDVNTAMEILKTGDLNFFKELYPNVKDTLAKCLRGVMIPRKGNILTIGDFSQIEVRVLAWIAGQDDLVELFRTGGLVYETMASKIYRIPVESISKESRERQLGKAAQLGCGYQMGSARFKSQVKTNEGVVISDALAWQIVYTYRNTYTKIPEFWKDQELAAKEAVRNGNTPIAMGKINWFYDIAQDFLFCYLPSGRRISYFKPRVEWHANKFGGKSQQLSYFRVNDQTWQYERAESYGGKLTENICSGIARDIMASAMLRLDKAGYNLVLSIHDEIISDDSEDFGSVEEYKSIMLELPDWAEGLPLDADVHQTRRYDK